MHGAAALVSAGAGGTEQYLPSGTEQYLRSTSDNINPMSDVRRVYLPFFNQEASECLGFDDGFDLRVFGGETGTSCRGKRTVGSVWAANEAGGRHVAH